MMRIDKQAQSVGAVSNGQGQGQGGGDAEIYTLWPQSVSLLTSNLAYKYLIYLRIFLLSYNALCIAWNLIR